MNRKQFLILVIVLVVLGGAGLALFWQDIAHYRESGARIGARLLPELKLADVTEVRLQDAREQVTLVNKGDRWVVQERGDYPANVQDIAGLLVKLVELKVTQAETVGTSLLPRVDLVAPGQEVFTAVVVGHDAEIGGTVREQLLVVNGTARVTGSVLGNVVVAGGRLELGPDATVAGDVALLGGTLARDPAAVVGGSVREHGLAVSGRVLRLLWAAMTFMIVVAAVLFAATGGRQLSESARLLTVRPVETLLAVAALWIAVPLLTGPLFLSVVGVPLAVWVLLFLLPALWFLGYIVAATAVGAALLRSAWDPTRPPMREAAAGVVALQLAAFIPVLGLVLVLIAGQAGAGALALRAWRGWQARRRVRPTVMQEAYL